MNAKITLGVALSVVALVGAAMLWYLRPPMPGDSPSPKLVELFNQTLDKQLAEYGAPRMPGMNLPEYRPEAATHARQWLSEVHEVVTHCEHNGHGNAHNDSQYDLTLRSGEVFPDLPAGSILGCSPRHDTPMRVTFEGGRVVQVTTDGSEREGTVAVASKRVEAYVWALLRRDEALRPERYFHASGPTHPAQEWGPH